MFTVVIAEKKHIDAIKNKNSLFFQSFIHNNEIAFCEWNTEGQSLSESVPDLVSLVGRHKLWKAIIVNSNSEEECCRINPFDEVDTQSILDFKKRKNDLEKNSETVQFDKDDAKEADYKKKWHEYYDGLLALKKESYARASQKPLQKLATYLCFKKDMYYDYAGKTVLQGERSTNSGTMSKNVSNHWIKKENIRQWLSEKFDLYNQRLSSQEADLSEKEKITLEEDVRILKSTIDKLRFNQLSAEEYLSIRERFEELNETRARLEEQFSRELLIAKEELHRQMTKDEETINIYLPSEVYCVALRTTEGTFDNPNLPWENRISTEYSDFAERNLFFDKMRFLVFDVLPQTHESYRNDYIRFLYAILLLASNEVPAGILTARRLYKLNSENDEEPLCEMATAYSKKLEETYDLLDKEIERIRTDLPGMFSDTEAENRFSRDKEVECPFEKDFHPSGLFVTESDYVQGLYWNDYMEEQWSKDYNKSEKTFKKLIKQPRRAIKSGVESMKDLSYTSVTEANRMTRFQVEDLRENTENAENEMVGLDIPNLFDFAPYKKRMDDQNKKLCKITESTMSKKTAFVLGCVCIGLLLLCFIPFVFNNRNTFDTVFISIIFAAAFLGVVALVLLVSLYFLHIPLRHALQDYNEEMQNQFDEIRNATDKIGHYLTKMASVRRGNKILKYVDNKVNSYSKEVTIRQKHQADIIRKKAFLLEEYGDYVNNDLTVESLDVSPYNYNFSKNKVYDYPAPYPTGNYKSMEFLVAGNRVAVPTAFAVRLYLTMEEIYD